MLLVVKFVLIQKRRSKLLYQINTISNELDFEKGTMFSRLNVACLIIEKDGTIRWFNDAFKTCFLIDNNTDVKNIKELIRKDNIEKLLGACGYRIKVDSRYFSIYSNAFEFENDSAYLLYFFDETKLRQTEKEYYDSRPSICLTSLDNSAEVYQNFKESECAEIFSQVDKILDDWTNQYGGL